MDTIQTDPAILTDYISTGLTDDKQEAVSSESEFVPEADCDSVDIDMSVIEADMDLEDLMKQKELLQAQLAKASGFTSPLEIANQEKVLEEVILLDDDSDEQEPVAVIKKKSRSRERKITEVKIKEDLRKKNSHSREYSYREQERRDR